MKSIPPLVIAAAMFVIVLGVPLCLYALLTRNRRQETNEIRTGAHARGWRYRLRRWQGNPAAFRIDGQTRNGQPWVVTSGNSGDFNSGWTVVLAQRFPKLAGEVDFALWEREAMDGMISSRAEELTPDSKAKIAAFSGTLASALNFAATAQESPTGLQPFDERYRVLLQPEQPFQAPVDRNLAERILCWPSDCITPHSILAWRDPFAVHFQVRLPTAPNLATVSYLTSLTEDLICRIPAARPASRREGIVDRIAARLFR